MRRSIKTNAILNVIKQIMQIIFPIITIPYVTRVLLPDNYGRINFGNSIISYIALIAGLGISAYAIREGSLVRDNKERLNAFANQVFSINILSTVIAYGFLAVLLIFVPAFKEYRLLLVIQSIAVVFTTLGADWINSIEEDYFYLTVRYIVLHIVALCLLFLFVKEPDDYYIYAIITLITTAGANALNLIYVRRYAKLRFTFIIDWREHLLPIMILFGNAIAMTIYVSSDITMIGLFMGDKEVGIYSIASKIYTVIKQIMNAVVIVAIPRLTAYIGSDEKSRFEELGKKILGVLVTMMIPLIVGVVVFRDEAIIVAGGKQYLAGSLSLSVLALAVVPSMIATFYSTCILMPLRKEKYILRGTLVAAVINVILNFIFIPWLGVEGAAVTTLISETYVAVYFYLLTRRESYSFINFRTLVVSAIGGVCVAVVACLSKALIESLLLCLITAIAISACIYIGVQLVGKNPSVMQFIPSIRRKKE